MGWLCPDFCHTWHVQGVLKPNMCNALFDRAFSSHGFGLLLFICSAPGVLSVPTTTEVRNRARQDHVMMRQAVAVQAWCE